MVELIFLSAEVTVLPILTEHQVLRKLQRRKRVSTIRCPPRNPYCLYFSLFPSDLFTQT